VGYPKEQGQPADAGDITRASMPPAFAGWKTIALYPQLALWATDMVAGYAGCIAARYLVK